MKFYFFAIIFSCSMVFIACGTDAKETDESLVSTSNVIPVQTTSKPDSSLLKPVNIPGNNTNTTAGNNAVTINPQNGTVSTSIPGNAVQTPANSAGLNPPHGQPGHRCDIAVGAPLNSKPDPPVTPAATVNQAPVITTQPVAQNVAPGMNPAHGQPGHRCDIAVGAPLNSKPAQAVTPSANANQEPVKTNVPVATQNVAPGMNPAHGQPGHRCDIAVGAPLNSKPAQPAAVTPAIVNPATTAPQKTDSMKN